MGAAELLSASTWWSFMIRWRVFGGLTAGHLLLLVASVDGGVRSRRVNNARGGSQTCITDARDPDQRRSPAVEVCPC